MPRRPGNAAADRERRRRFLMRQMFELQVRRAKGENYQAFFNKIMHARFPDFRPMQPYGNVGDRKNDGYIPASGKYFQLFAPSDPELKVAAAAAKAAEDFQGLREFWQKKCPIKEYWFAYNDEFDGSVVPIEQALLAINKKYGVTTGPFLCCHLQDVAMDLPLEKLEEALNFLSLDYDDLADADFNALKEVVQHVMNSQAIDVAAARLLSPKFDEKIKFNGLSPAIADILRAAARQTDAIDDFFSRRSASHKQDLRDHLASLYEREKKKVKAGRSDAVFAAILDAIVPEQQRRSKQVLNAAWVVVAYFFEACDLFEGPDAAPGKTHLVGGVDPRPRRRRARQA